MVFRKEHALILFGNSALGLGRQRLDQGGQKDLFPHEPHYVEFLVDLVDGYLSHGEGSLFFEISEAESAQEVWELPANIIEVSDPGSDNLYLALFPKFEDATDQVVVE